MNPVSGDKLVAVSIAMWSTEEVNRQLTQNSDIASQPWLTNQSQPDKANQCVLLMSALE